MVIGQNTQGRHHIPVVCQRFAHAHEHDIGNDSVAVRVIAQLTIGKPHLADDLRSAEIAVESLPAGRTERTIERATDLT